MDDDNWEGEGEEDNDDTPGETPKDEYDGEEEDDKDDTQFIDTDPVPPSIGLGASRLNKMSRSPP